MSTHIVAGTGLFSDIFASFSDIFGGRSQTYQKQLTAINNEAIDQLRQKAANLGANAIIGLSIDHDEISGSGKSMFMVTVTGTAVVTETLEADNTSPHDQKVELSADALKDLIQRRQLIEDIKTGNITMSTMTREIWSFLCQYQVHEVASNILAGVARAETRTSNTDLEFIKQSEAYFMCLPQEIAKQYLYGAVNGNNKTLFPYALNLLDEMKLFDYESASKMLNTRDLKVD